MQSGSNHRLAPPQNLFDSYKNILGSALLLNGCLDASSISEVEGYLNASQPATDEDHKCRALIQYLYRKNPSNFIRFLVRSKLSHLILWTEAKSIVRFLGLQGVLYIKWNGTNYECSLHSNRDPSVQTTRPERPRRAAHGNYNETKFTNTYSSISPDEPVQA